MRRALVLSAVAVMILSATPAAPAAPLLVTCFGVKATIPGTAGDDVLNGTSGVDVIQGLGGNDIINGLGGDDLLCGGAGNDTIEGGAGHDLILGGGGHDEIRGQSGRDAIGGQAGSDRIRGGGGRDVILGNKGADQMWGKAGGDYLEGNVGTDTADGGTHRDWCRAETQTSCEGPAGAWRLKATGIGSIPFGTPTDIALVEFALFGDPMLEGDPDEDSGWIPSFSIYGTCPNEQVRMVRWGNLRTFFTRTGLTEGEFFSWDVIEGHPDLKLATPHGLRHGDTRGQLELLYKVNSVEYIDPFDIWHFYVKDNPSGISGSLSDDTFGARITYLQGGIGCGE